MNGHIKPETKDLLIKDMAAANKGFVIAGISFFASTFVQGGCLVLQMKLRAIKPAITNLRTLHASVNDDRDIEN